MTPCTHPHLPPAFAAALLTLAACGGGDEPAEHARLIDASPALHGGALALDNAQRTVGLFGPGSGIGEPYCVAQWRRLDNGAGARYTVRVAYLVSNFRAVGASIEREDGTWAVHTAPDSPLLPITLDRARRRLQLDRAPMQSLDDPASRARLSAWLDLPALGLPTPCEP